MASELIKYEDIKAALLTGREIDIVEPEQVSGDIVKRILESDNVEEAFGGFEATPASEIEGLVCTVHDLTWMRSTYEEGPPVYALMRVTVGDHDKPMVVSMGGRSVLAGLLWSQKNKALPVTGVFRRKGSANGSGNSYWTFQLSVTVARA